MAATQYSILRGSGNLVSVLDTASNPLTPFATGPGLGFFSPTAPGGGASVSVWLYLSGFTTADPADSNVRVRVRLPEPIIVAGDGASVSPRLNNATPMWSIAPANNNNAGYYALQPVVFGSGLDFTPGAVNTEQDVSIDCQTPLAAATVDMMLRIDFPNTRPPGAGYFGGL